MTERTGEKSFNTLRGFIDGEEPDEPVYFAYSASRDQPNGGMVSCDHGR